MRSNKLGLAPSPEVHGRADGRSQPQLRQLTAGTACDSCIAGVLVAEQESTIASGGKDAFTRCVSAMSLCSLFHHPLESWGEGEQLT